MPENYTLAIQRGSETSLFYVRGQAQLSKSAQVVTKPMEGDVGAQLNPVRRLPSNLNFTLTCIDGGDGNLLPLDGIQSRSKEAQVEYLQSLIGNEVKIYTRGISGSFVISEVTVTDDAQFDNVLLVSVAAIEGPLEDSFRLRDLELGTIEVPLPDGVGVTQDATGLDAGTVLRAMTDEWMAHLIAGLPHPFDGKVSDMSVDLFRWVPARGLRDPGIGNLRREASLRLTSFRTFMTTPASIKWLKFIDGGPSSDMNKLLDDNGIQAYPIPNPGVPITEFHENFRIDKPAMGTYRLTNKKNIKDLQAIFRAPSDSSMRKIFQDLVNEQLVQFYRADPPIRRSRRFGGFGTRKNRAEVNVPKALLLDLEGS